MLKEKARNHWLTFSLPISIISNDKFHLRNLQVNKITKTKVKCYKNIQPLSQCQFHLGFRKVFSWGKSFRKEFFSSLSLSFPSQTTEEIWKKRNISARKITLLFSVLSSLGPLVFPTTCHSFNRVTNKQTNKQTKNGLLGFGALYESISSLVFRCKGKKREVVLITFKK
jgi:hypothetical protein